MNRIKKIAGIISVLWVAIAVAFVITWMTSTGENKAGAFDAISKAQRSEDTERQIDWDSLPAEVIAWVEVPGTSIDEPIVQATPDAPNAYLYRDALGQNAYGTPYIDCECTFASSFVIIYGHHMSDGSAFADFASYIEKTYAREHDEIILYQREGKTLHLTPIAVDVVNASRERLNIDQEIGPAKRIAGSDLIIEEPDEGARLFAFATCSYQTWNSRTIIYARSTDSNPIEDCMSTGDIQ